MKVAYPAIMQILGLLLLLPLVAAGGEIYTRNGVTDGDTFYLAPAAFANDDPAYQSWVAYSLMKSTCQLEIGGDNPAQASSFDCELTARRHLINAWEEKRQQNQDIKDKYLDALGEVQFAGFLAEYTQRYFGKKHWEPSEGLRMSEFQAWQKKNLRSHRPETRIIGSWNYQPVRKIPGSDSARRDPEAP
jgi:hypothetical protein